jgi:hypothetical protein
MKINKLICLSASISFLIFPSCENSIVTVPKESITIVENIVLGSDADTLFINLKNRNVKVGNYKTDLFFQDENTDNDNRIRIPYTEVFNFGEYRNKKIDLDHLGLIYPILLYGTNRIQGLSVLLVSTHMQIFNSNNANDPVVKQEVNESLINDIEKLFIKKYGQPKSREKSKNHKVYSIEGSEIKEYDSTEDYCDYVVWENEFMIIELFKGYKSYETSFNPINTCYSHEISGNSPQVVIPETGYTYSRTMPAIHYQLKDTTIKILGLDKKMIL